MGPGDPPPSGAGLGVRYLPPIWFGDEGGGGDGDTQTRPRSAPLPCLLKDRQWWDDMVDGGVGMTVVRGWC